MCMDNKNIGSLRCICCDRELKDYENVICFDCESKSSIEKDINELVNEVLKDY